jgi:uncharacterized membrane protein YeaQ/YmgE (transglycosylase-associated protein family)
MLCQLVVSVLIIGPFWFYVYFLLTRAGAIDPSVKDSINQVTGAVLTFVAGIVGFWLGSSLSSSSKDATISQFTNTQGTAR